MLVGFKLYYPKCKQSQIECLSTTLILRRRLPHPFFKPATKISQIFKAYSKLEQLMIDFVLNGVANKEEAEGRIITRPEIFHLT